MTPRTASLLLPLCPLLLAAAPPTPAPSPAPTAPTTQPQRPAPALHLVNDLGARVAPESALGRRLPDVKFNQVTLEDAVDFLRDVSGANIHVNWRALEGLGVTRQTPVSMQLSDVPMRRVLRSLLDECGGPNQLTYYVDEGVIEITSREMADSQLITKVYPVEDLVVEIPNFAGPTFNLQEQSNQVSGGGGGGGGGGSSSSLFGGNGSSANGTGNGLDQQTTKQQRGESLVDTIKQTVQPSIWRDNGGTASIRYFNGHLIVTAPRSVHEAISGKP